MTQAHYTNLATLTLTLAATLAACGDSAPTVAPRADAGTLMEAGADAGPADAASPGIDAVSPEMDAGAAMDVVAPIDTGVPADLGTGADGFSTWVPGSPEPPLTQLVTNFRSTLTLSYGNAATPVEEVMDGREGGVSYYFNFADALGRFVYLSREGCAFDGVHVFKVATAGIEPTSQPGSLGG